MARHVHLRVAPTQRLPSGGGARAVALLLRVRGVTVLDWRLVGLENSALSLARAAAADHTAAADERDARAAEWPLFFCPESLVNRCGEVADLSVAHAGDTVTLTDFYGCLVARESRYEVPWSAFAAAVVRLGDAAVRRSGGDVAAVSSEDAALRVRWRAELRERLRPIRARLRRATRAAVRGGAGR